MIPNLIHREHFSYDEQVPYFKQQSGVSFTYIKLLFFFHCDVFNASKHGLKSIAGTHNTMRAKNFI